MSARAALLACALLLALPAQAQMYKCVDARGVTQYSDKPCPGGKGKAVDIRGQPPISGTLAPRGADTGAAENEFRRRQIERGREEEVAAARAEQQKRRCAELRAELQRWNSVNRVAVTDAKGERRYLEDSEREAKKAQLEAGIVRDCR